jgi:ABC-type Zn uptake system ZnuABC Zn-binding protein ZnuA
MPIPPRTALLLLAMPVLLIAAACGGGDDDAGEGIRRVVATTPQIGALAREVGGEHIALTVLLRPGVDPHDYELTARDRKAVDSAQVILRHGIGLDQFLDDAVKSGSNKDRAVTVTDGIELRGEGASKDPHVWQDPQRVKQMVDAIVVALAASDSANAADYRANGDAYKATLDATDAEIRALIDSIPPANRKMVTNHDAFGYFIERYGLAFVGAVIPSITTSAEPSPKDIAALVDTIKRENVRAIFAESSLDPKVAQQIARDTGVKVIDDLYGDSLGEPGSGAETVHGMLLANAKTIAEALR